jgi:hypothetical protein
MTDSNTSADKPNLAQTKSSGGKTVETNPPVAPKGVNSSIRYQNDGSSLPKTSQGILESTQTYLNNLIPAHGCPIDFPAIKDQFETWLKNLISTETNRGTDFATWLPGSMVPIVEAIGNAIKAIKSMIKMIEKLVKEIQKIVKMIQQWITEIMQFIQFVMSLPARLMNILMECISSFQGAALGVIKDGVNAAGSAISSAASSAAKASTSTSSTTSTSNA